MAKNKVYRAGRSPDGELLAHATRVGVYVRLSKEDSRTGESVSIENQKLMLTNYVAEKGWILVDVYQDDGFSGTNQNRPAFQRMMADVESKFINTILIKDLSRLGRNYLEVGNLAEVFLPEHGCELISLNEKLDDMMVFRNWFNEQHSKSTSVKVRAGRRTSAQKGRYMGAYAPYGYKKDAGTSRLVVDEVTAPIVRRIYQMRLQGIGHRAIAISLNADGIASPREYYYQQTGKKNPKQTRKIWGETSVADIIKNEVYIGNTVSNKIGTMSYKNQKMIKKDEEDWVRVENTHEAIIDKEVWHKLQAFKHKNYRPRTRKDGGTNLYAGFLYCADCGFKLRGHVERKKRADGTERVTNSYICSTYGNNGKNACTIHSIAEVALTEILLNHIRSLANAVTVNSESIKNRLLSAKQKGNLSYQSVFENELKAHQAQIDKLDALIESLYADKVSGLVPDSLFKRQIVKYEAERAERMSACELLEKRIGEVKPMTENANEWVSLIQQYANIEAIDKETLFMLIDRIIVSEAKLIGGRRVCDVRIIYNFIGEAPSTLAGTKLNTEVYKKAIKAVV